MGLKTYFCPNCNCVLVLPQFDGETVVTCIACHVPVTLAMKAGKLDVSTAPIAERS